MQATLIAKSEPQEMYPFHWALTEQYQKSLGRFGAYVKFVVSIFFFQKKTCITSSTLLNNWLNYF